MTILQQTNRMLNRLARRTAPAPQLPAAEVFWCVRAGKSYTTAIYQTLPTAQGPERTADCPYCDVHGRLLGEQRYDAYLPARHTVGYDTAGTKVRYE